MVWLPVFVPVAGGLLILLVAPPRRAALAGTLLLVAVTALALVVAWREPHATAPWGGLLRLELAALGPARVLVVLVPLVAAPIVAFAGDLFSGETHLRRLSALLVAFVGAMELLVLANDLLTLLVAWEIVAGFSWALIAHDWGRRTAAHAALESLLTVRLGAVGLVVAAGALFADTGSLSYAALDGAGETALGLVAAGVLLAAVAKSAQVPFSFWLFSAMEGPAPVSALLHSATMVAAGPYVLIRLQPYLEPVDWFAPALITVGLTSAVAGGVVATLQTDFKRALAASTTSQYGLMLVAVGAGAVYAATAHLVAHALFKSLLFLGAGLLVAVAVTGQFAGLRSASLLLAVRGRRLTALFVGIGALALAAVPPLGGAFTKEGIVEAAWEQAPWLGVAVLLAGLLSALYAGRLFLLSYAPALMAPRSPRATEPRSRLPGSASLVGMGSLAAASVLLGLLALPPVETAFSQLTGGEPRHLAGALLLASLGSIAVAFALVEVLRRREALFGLGLPKGAQTAAADWLGLLVVARRGVAGPVFSLARSVRRVDDQLIDVGVWGVAASALRSARRAASFDDRVVDAVVVALARLGLLSASLSRLWDDLVIDGAVERVGRLSTRAGQSAQRLQNGMSHDYYIAIAAGTAVAVLLAAIAV